MRWKYIIITIFLIILGLIIYGCGAGGGGGGGSAASRVYLGSQAQGDRVRFTLNPSSQTFEFYNFEDLTTVTGKYMVSSNTTLGSDIPYYVAYDLVVNGTPEDEMVPFLEVAQTALICYLPEDDQPCIFSYYTGTTSFASYAGDYYYLDVVTNNAISEDPGYGYYSVYSDGQLDVTSNKMSDDSLDSTLNVQMSISPQGYVLVPANPTVSVAICPSGVMVIDKGLNEGNCIGVKESSTSLNGFIDGTYVVLTTHSNNVGRVEVAANNDISYTMYVPSENWREDATGNITSVNEESKGMFFASQTEGIDTIRYRFIVFGDAFFGIRRNQTNGECSSFIGLKKQ